MGFGWRRRRSNAGDNGGKEQEGGIGGRRELELQELVIPNHFVCPISLELMRDPVTLSSGITYDRESIERWLEAGNFTCPVTNVVLSSFDQIPNHVLRSMIQEWCTENCRHGVNRIPTPRVPVTPFEVSEVLSGIDDASQCVDHAECAKLVGRIEKWGGESERNRRCITANGAASTLSRAFDAFAAASDYSQIGANMLEEILCALSWMFPLDIDARHYLASRSSLNCLVWFLKNGDTEFKKHAILTLNELSRDEKQTEALAYTEGLRETLVKFIEHPISPTITKASLSVTFNLISSNGCGDEERLAFVEMSLVSKLLEILVDSSDKSVCEKALGVLHGLIGCEQGREKAYANLLTVPILVKKILRVPGTATEFAVLSLWRLCKHESRDHQEMALVEALQVGAFQKLLLLLQVGCADEAKEKATELLKLMNPYRAGLECIESADFKNLKRSF
ncbi:U-box domain-containing protein 21 [Eucalyptus grandis]|uniref:U-box domain-containing protein 21 n=1 Tax=Eucalyptus grandis TaxID=71139 RepID=UPI000525EF73|nr:U-box domain-containing protein 21 [Eucalyptus grandis]